MANKPTLDKILDWHMSAILEATFTGQDVTSIKVTEELITKHKSKAKQALEELMLSSLPEKQTKPVRIDSLDHGYKMGWNEAIDAVTELLKQHLIKET